MVVFLLHQDIKRHDANIDKEIKLDYVRQYGVFYSDQRTCSLLNWNLIIYIHLSFSQLGNYGNSAISAKGKGLTNVKMYVERTVFSKGKI